MRIIAGYLGGRRLRTGRGEGYRPAMSRTRESLFSSLDSILRSEDRCWAGIGVLDLFAGSGSLAFEAVSRGAEFATLVENSDQAVSVLAENIAALDLGAKVGVVSKDVIRFLRSRQQGTPDAGQTALPLYSLVFIDPPYKLDCLGPVLQLLVSRGWLAPSAIIVAELEKHARIPRPASLEFLSERLFGQTRLCLWRQA